MLTMDPKQSATMTARETAAALSISERHLWSLVSRGELPQPIRLGRAARWNRAALEQFLAERHAEAQGGERCG